MKPILEIKGVGKKFKIQHEQQSYLSLRDSFSNLFNPKKSSDDYFWALKDISFNINPGDSVGIIGRNGAGKSTLLKILSKITPPSTGKIISRGRIASLLEVGTGFHPELTGRENIYLNGSILGLKKTEINKQFDAIVDFSGVNRFIDTPLKHYSSGMQLRLAFAVAAHLEPEILIIDEVLAVGDNEFQEKCVGKMNEVSKDGRTILFVSHDLNSVSKLCSRLVTIKEGEISYEGDVEKGILEYQNFNKSSNNAYVASGYKKNKPVFFEKVLTTNTQDESAVTFFVNQKVKLHFVLGRTQEDVKCDLFVMVLNENKKRVCAFEYPNIKSSVSLEISEHFLVRGKYSIVAYLNIPNIARLDELEDICSFEIIDNSSLYIKHGNFNYGDVYGNGEWKLLE